MRGRKYRFSLYKIKDKNGKVVPFKINAVQEHLLDNVWYRNIILKSRQHGISTLIEAIIADECLIKNNLRAAIIADTLPHAVALLAKIKFIYRNLPVWFIEYLGMPVIQTSSATKMTLYNGSEIVVDTSVRSGTFQLLHISEFGKICAKRPDKAEEIVTGALESVGTNQYIFIESTAQGSTGYFYEYCKRAQDMYLKGEKLSQLDYKFFFYPWWMDKRNVLKLDNFEISDYYHKYFEDLSTHEGVNLSLYQKYWYIKKAESLQDKMFQEHPSTPEEAFKASVEGAYYSKQFYDILRTNRITKVPHDNTFDVYTGWDIGIGDSTAIWFAQVVGKEIHLIDYYENSGEGLGHYIRVLNDRGYKYAMHFFPHDFAAREFGTGRTRETILREDYAIRNYEVIPRHNIADGIEIVRRKLGVCWFDENKCKVGIDALRNYRKEWDNTHEVFKSQPLHDWASHGADAFRTLMMGLDKQYSLRNKPILVKPVKRKPLFTLDYLSCYDIIVII